MQLVVSHILTLSRDNNNNNPDFCKSFIETKLLPHYFNLKLIRHLTTGLLKVWTVTWLSFSREVSLKKQANTAP